MAAIAGTSAIYLENVGFNNKFQLDAEEIEHTETFTSPDDWVPCEETPKTVVTTNKSNHPVKVRLNYDEWWRNQADTENLPVEQDGHRLTTINFQNEDDWELSGNWYYWKGELAPGESTRSLFKSVTFDCSANFAVQHVCTDQGCTDVHSPYEGADYHILITVQTTDEDFPHDETFSVSIDPNGGEFNGSTDVYTDTVQYGTVIDLSNISYTDHELVDWTKNGSESYTDNRLRVINDVTLVANWQSSIFHTVTVNPNGGSLDGSTEPIETNVRQGESFTLTDSIPTLEGYVFNHWDIKVGDGETAPISDYTFTVSDDVTITATYDKAIARNTRTNKEYASITAAISDNTLQAGDTVLLLTDTEETVTIPEGKDFTLDLGEFIVTGSITNNGTLTLLNGEINNPDGAAFVNNGTLTMGINDYLDAEEQRVNIQDEYVRLIGTTTGIDQNGIFNYYDGYIEGDVALEGGYNAAPSYRNTFDGVIVYYFPLVDFNNVKQLQHVSLASSDNAVSKTVDNGAIYYYNLQDNINTSVRTGYKIYIVRDFDAGYTITSPADTDVTIDLSGYDISLNDTITINGKLTIEDSTTTVETVDNGDGVDGDLLMPSISGNVAITPHKTTTTTVTYGGKISVPQTIINNDNFVMKNVYITGTTANDTIQNYATLTMENAILGATTGYVMQPIENASYNLDENSYFASISTRAAINNSIDGYEWDAGGNIYSLGIGLASAGKTISHKNGVIFGATNSISGGIVIIDGGTAKSLSSSGASAVYAATYANMKSGYVVVRANEMYYPARGISTDNGTCLIESGVIDVANNGNGGARGVIPGWADAATMTGGIVKVTSNGTGQAIGVYGARSPISVTNGTIEVKNTSTGDAIGISDTTRTSASVANSTITSTSINGKAYGAISVPSSGGSSYMALDGTVSYSSSTINVHGKQDSYGVYGGKDGLTYGTATVTGGTLTVVSDTGTSYGINASKNVVRSGKIIAGNYGIYTQSGTTTIGNNDDETLSISSPEIIGGDYAIFNGTYNFYDGVLRGGNKAYIEGEIIAIPDATTYHVESSEDYDENCWLVPSANYLEVAGIQYNSLKKAYDAIEGDTGTIKVIASTTVEATLPASPAGKEITFDLNGHQLTYTQPLINNGAMTVIDSSQDKTGKIITTSSSTGVIENRGTLLIDSANIVGNYCAIMNQAGGNLTVENSIITGANRGICGAGTSSKRGVISIIGTTKITASNGIYSDSYTDVTINDSSEIIATSYGVYSGTAVINSGTIKSGYAGVYASSYVNMKSGHIIVESDAGNSMSYGVQVNDGTTDIEGGIIEVTAVGKGGATGVRSGWYDATNITNGDIRVTSQNTGDAIAVFGYRSNISISNSSLQIVNTNTGSAEAITDSNRTNATISNSIVSVVSNGGKAFGIISRGATSSTGTPGAEGYASFVNSNVDIHGKTDSYGINGITTSGYVGVGAVTGGTLTVVSDTGTSYGINASKNVVRSGKIIAGNYGIYTQSGTTTIGNNDDETLSISSPEIIGGDYAIFNGTYNFYDGVLRGGNKAYIEGEIIAIPDATTYHVESSEDYDENCWLVPSANYLEVAGIQYNSLKKAYDAIEGDTGTIKVIASTTVEATLPASPAGKEITFDLNGHQLTYTQPLINNGAMTVIDSSQDKTGKLFGTNSNLSTIENNGSLTIDSVYVSSSYCAVTGNAGTTTDVADSIIRGTKYGLCGNGSYGNNKTATINVTGATDIEVDGGGISGNIYTSVTFNAPGKIKTNGNGIYAGNVVFNGGIIDVVGVTGATSIYGIESLSYANVKGGTITVDAGSSWNRAYGVGGNDGSVVIEGGTITSSASSSTGGAVGVSVDWSDTLTVTGGTIRAISDSNGSANAIFGVNSYFSISGCTIEATNTGTGDAIGIGDSRTGYVSISDSTITATSSNKTAIGVSIGGEWRTGTGSMTFRDATITAHGSADSYGVKGTKDGNYIASTAIYSGTIIAASDNGTAYGIYASSNSIQGGKIVGGNYGVYTLDGTTTIGNNDDETLSITIPEIIGGDYAVYGASNNFYDGVLRGGISAYQEGSVTRIATNTTIHVEQTTIDGEEYETRYLINEYDIAKIGAVKYVRLSDAISAAEEGDIIELLDNIYLFDTLTIPADKDIKIEMYGYRITTNSSIENNGLLEISSNNGEAIIINRTSNYAIINNQDADTKISDITLDVAYGIYNSGTLELENTVINATSVGIKNNGNLTGDNSIKITGSEYSIYSESGSAVITDYNATGKVYSNAGSVSLNDGQIIPTSNEYGLVTAAANGEINLTSTQISALANYYASSNAGSSYRILLENAGTLNITDSSIAYSAQDRTNVNVFLFYNTGNSVISNSTLSADSDGLSNPTRYSPYTIQAINNPTGSVTVLSGSAIASGKTAYGIYNDTGVVTLGVPEDPGSQDYGRATADVSTTNPDIRAIGTSSGIGVKNANGGKVYYYDGKITGSTAAMPENPAGLEYMYEPKDYTDENGYQFRILEWMREQPGN